MRFYILIKKLISYEIKINKKFNLKLFNLSDCVYIVINESQGTLHQYLDAGLLSHWRTRQLQHHAVHSR